MIDKSPYFEKTKSLRFWVQHVLPLVYDDSLSYYELLAKVVEKINILIENNNKLPDFIVEMIKEQLKLENLIEILKELIREVINMEYYTKAEIDAMLEELNTTIDAEIEEATQGVLKENAKAILNAPLANQLDLQYVATVYNNSVNTRSSFFGGYYNRNNPHNPFGTYVDPDTGETLPYQMYTPVEVQGTVFLGYNSTTGKSKVGIFSSVGSRGGGYGWYDDPALLTVIEFGRSLLDAKVIKRVMYDSHYVVDASYPLNTELEKVVSGNLMHCSSGAYVPETNSIYVSTRAFRDKNTNTNVTSYKVVEIDATTYEVKRVIDTPVPPAGTADPYIPGGLCYDMVTGKMYNQYGRKTFEVDMETWTETLVYEFNTFWSAGLATGSTFGMQGACVHNGYLFLTHSRPSALICVDLNKRGKETPHADQSYRLPNEMPTSITKVYSIPEGDCYGHFIHYVEVPCYDPLHNCIYLSTWENVGDGQQYGTNKLTNMYRVNPFVNQLGSPRVGATSDNDGMLYTYPFIYVDSTRDPITYAHRIGTAEKPFYCVQEALEALALRSNKYHLRIKNHSTYEEQFAIVGENVKVSTYRLYYTDINGVKTYVNNYEDAPINPATGSVYNVQVERAQSGAYFTVQSAYFDSADVHFDAAELRIANQYDSNAFRAYGSNVSGASLALGSITKTGTAIVITDSTVLFDSVTGSKNADAKALVATSSNIKLTLPATMHGDVDIDNTVCQKGITLSASDNVVTLYNKSANEKIINNVLTKYIVLDGTWSGWCAINYTLNIGSFYAGYRTTDKVFKTAGNTRHIMDFITDDVYVNFTIGSSGAVSYNIRSRSDSDVSAYSLEVYGVMYDITF